MKEETILEGIAEACVGEGLDLIVKLGAFRGIIPRDEAALEGDGKSAPRDISVITRVGRPVCFTVTDIISENGNYTPVLSRKAAQKKCRNEYIANLAPGDVTDARITHLDPFGAFADIGCGIVSLLCVDCISVSRISHPSERLKKGEDIKAVVKSIDPDSGRIYLTLRELLGTWEENAASFEIGSTVAGIVRGIEDYGIFVELSPNLAGLAERKSGVAEGDVCAVYIKNIIKERMKVKLAIIDSYAKDPDAPPLKYYTDTSKVRHIDRWRYSPEGCAKIIETVF
ncbi:MAG: 30S ribosomal protein S1 [Clostridia bacterium]|nr:30S ribosomal protein S1 [Clostridia bacterium]